MNSTPPFSEQTTPSQTDRRMLKVDAIDPLAHKLCDIWSLKFKGRKREWQGSLDVSWNERQGWEEVAKYVLAHATPTTREETPQPPVIGASKEKEWFDERIEAHAIAAKCQYDDIYYMAIAAFKKLRASLSQPDAKDTEREFLVSILDDVTGYGDRPPALYRVEERLRERLKSIYSAMAASKTKA